MPETKAHPTHALFGDLQNVVSLPPEARQVGAVSRSAIIAKAEQAIEFHRNVAAYHTREAEKIRGTVQRLKERKS